MVFRGKNAEKPLLTLNFWQGKRSKQRNYHHWAGVYLAQLPRCQAQHVSLQSLNCREPVRVSKRRLPLIKDYSLETPENPLSHVIFPNAILCK